MNPGLPRGEFRLEGGKALFPGFQLIRLCGGRGLRLLGIRDPFVDGPLEDQEVLLFVLEIGPTLGEVLEILPNGRLPAL